MTDITAPAPATMPVTGRFPRWATMGVLFGLVSIAAIFLYGPIGVSTTYPRAIGWLAALVNADYAAGHPYLQKIGSVVKPESMLVVGLLIGGFLASRLPGTPRAPAAEMSHAVEKTTRRRYIDAFLGGFLIIFGARLAGGCTSGHIISGMTQLALSGFLFCAAVFGAGIVTAKLLRGGH